MAPTPSTEASGRGRIAFLSTDSLEDFVCDDELAAGALVRAGWQVVTVSWKDTSADWDGYDLVVVRSTWDYQDDPDRFLAVLASIDRSRARLANPLAAMRWNLDKRYLLELADRGVEVVPTVAGHGGDVDDLAALTAQTGWHEFVIKPAVGANADHTYRLRWPAPADTVQRVLASHGASAWLAQPFVASIVTEGEFSLFFLGGELSHAILKTPAAGDFRVQEEHGGVIRAVAADDSLRAAGAAVMQALPADLLYARVDLARDTDGRFLLMEVEIVEPSLYFRMDAAAPARFAVAVGRWLDSARRGAPDHGT